MRQLVWKILNFVRLGAPLQLILKSMLQEQGWFNSFRTKESVNKIGEPLPWWTYSCLHFIEPRLLKNMSIFEYGAGNSTRWLAPRVMNIIAVEHDKIWLNKLQTQIPQNARVVLCEESNYAESVLGHDKKFDIIIIDGIERNKCTQFAIKALRSNGVIIFDNSDRQTLYQESFEILHQAGFKRLDFYGMCPVVADASCSSIFYRTNNCLYI